MIGLDLAREALFTHHFVKDFKDTNATSNMLYNLFQHYKSEDFEIGFKLYDVFTILYLLDPEAFNVKGGVYSNRIKWQLYKGSHSGRLLIWSIPIVQLF